MASLRHELAEWFGRAVIVARGADAELLGAERALAAGDASLALRHARDLLSRVPRSPIGLLLAADAAEAAWLDDEAAGYLATLADVVPYRAEVWLRLGLAGKRAGHPRGQVRDALARAAADQASTDVATRAALALAELDLAEGDPARALVWLRDRVGAPAAELRASALLDLGDVAGARAAAEGLEPPGPLDGRRALLFGRLAAAGGGGGDPRRLLLRAYILDEPGALRALASFVSHGGAREADAVLPIVEARGDRAHPLLRAAEAQARGDREAALEALGAAADGGDRDAARALAGQAVDARDRAALARAHRALARLGQSPSPIECAVLAGAEALSAGDARAVLAALGPAGDHPWACALREAAARLLAPLDGDVALPLVLAELREAARELDDAEALLAGEALAIVAARPLRVAVMGEFNAGKSTFVNALLGADIAPTGVLPTTATLHHVIFSPDAFARIQATRAGTGAAAERVVPPERLRAALREVQDAGDHVVRVTVGMPLARLRAIELVDTPGFNAPDVAHGAEARAALAEVDLVLWLLDAAQAWKDSERAVLAQVRATGVPVQVLVNKIDRVQPHEQGAVMRHVDDALRQTGTTSLVPPRALSSRLALAGRLGDEAALAASGFAAIDALVESEIVARAPRLKDAALRRRARALASSLLARARTAAEGEHARARAEGLLRGSYLDGAARLGADFAAAVRLAGRALDEPRRALVEDLAPLAVAHEGPDGAAAATSFYAAERAVYRLTLPLSRALVARALGEGAAKPEADLLQAVDAAVEASLRGFVSALPRPSDVTTTTTERLVAASLASARAAFLRESARWSAPPQRAAPLVPRLDALEKALALAPG